MMRLTPRMLKRATREIYYFSRDCPEIGEDSDLPEKGNPIYRVNIDFTKRKVTTTPCQPAQNYDEPIRE